MDPLQSILIIPVKGVLDEFVLEEVDVYVGGDLGWVEHFVVLAGDFELPVSEFQSLEGL